MDFQGFPFAEAAAGSVQDSWNRKGLVSELGEPKIAFAVLAASYDNKERAHTRSGAYPRLTIFVHSLRMFTWSGDGYGRRESAGTAVQDRG